METKNSVPQNDLGKFEEKFGQPKIKELTQKLAAERAKVEALADVQDKIRVVQKPENTIRFALTGDWHFGSLYHHGPGLEAFFEHLKEVGIDDVYCTGDILDGHRVYRGQEFELRDVGMEKQLDRLVESVPKGFKVSFITGNHDNSFKQLAGYPAGKLIEERMSGWTFLGEDHADVEFDTPTGKYVLQLLHPTGGSAYAISYRPQKIIESIEGGKKPNMLAIGHYHKAEIMPSYRNVTLAQTGTFQKQTPFMATKALAAHVGGWIIEVSVGKLNNTIRSEFVAFY